MVVCHINSEEVSTKIQSPDRLHRIQGLKILLAATEDEDIQDADLELTYNDCYLYILKCYADKFESCRELATQVITGFLSRLPKNDFYLQNVISSLVSRIGKKELVESSEEMRLIFMRQLNFLIQRYKIDESDSNDYLSQSYNDIIDIMLKTLTDPYPAVQKEACYCVVNLASATSSFHLRAETLAVPLYPLLHHKHSQNRIASIEALGFTALHIFSNPECLVRIFTEVSPLLMDSVPLVRLNCGNVGCKWLLELRDRYSYFERILPLVLCCLKDDSPDVQHNIRQLWIQCGQQYYEENELELSKLEIADYLPNNYPEGVQRPSLGCRALVQRSLRVVQLIMRETSDWKEEVRLHSLKLLYQVVLHAEQAVTAKFFEILPDLARSCADQETSVCKEAMHVSDLMGRLLKYDDWKEHAFQGLASNGRIGYLKCFYKMLSPVRVEDLRDILKISEILVEKEFSHNFKSEFQGYILKLVRVLMDKYQEIRSRESLEENLEDLSLECSIQDEIEKNLYVIVIKVTALAFNDSETSVMNEGKDILCELSVNARELHDRHLQQVIASIDDFELELDGQSEPILLLNGIIQICGFQHAYLAQLKTAIKTVCEHALPDGKIKILSAVSVAMLRWTETLQMELAESRECLRDFVTSVLQEQLIWKAGACAESMRSLAVATLCAMTQGAPEESVGILPNLTKYFPQLIEDNSASTRGYALKCFLNFGPMTWDQLQPIGHAILQRLDDPSATIRELAARVIAHLQLTHLDDSEKDSYETFVGKVFQMLFIHFEGNELKLKDTVKESLLTLGKNHPEIFKNSLKTAQAKFSVSSSSDLHHIAQLIIAK